MIFRFLLKWRLSKAIYMINVTFKIENLRWDFNKEFFLKYWFWKALFLNSDFSKGQFPLHACDVNVICNNSDTLMKNHAYRFLHFMN